MPATISDVAARAGVSTATVSRVFNDRSGIKPETRERVLQAARELNYHPSIAARSLATARSYNIGYIGYKYGSSGGFPTDTSASLEGIDEELTRAGYHLLITWVNRETVKKLEMPNMVRQGRVDALIVDGPAISARFILQLRNTGLPIILVDNYLNETAIDCILSDNEGGAYQAVQHLFEHGHERIVFLSGPAHWLSSRERAGGYRHALDEAGLEPRIVFMPSTTVHTGYEAMHTALKEYPDLTAVMAVNDAVAVGAIRACQEANRPVPEEIAIIGFDDVAWIQHITPLLTTVHIHWHEIGIQAARRVVDMLERDELIPLKMRQAVQLVIRQSCGCSETT